MVERIWEFTGEKQDHKNIVCWSIFGICCYGFFGWKKSEILIGGRQQCVVHFITWLFCTTFRSHCHSRKRDIQRRFSFEIAFWMNKLSAFVHTKQKEMKIEYLNAFIFAFIHILMRDIDCKTQSACTFCCIAFVFALFVSLVFFIMHFIFHSFSITSNRRGAIIFSLPFRTYIFQSERSFIGFDIKSCDLILIMNVSVNCPHRISRNGRRTRIVENGTG